MLEAWARNGLTYEQIASNIGITAKTLYEWQNKYGEICEALKRGREVVDILVENSLLKRALGYEYIEEKTKTYKVNGADVTEKTVTTKQVVPDTTAQIFWLKNRKPSQWRDKAQVDMDVEFSKVDELINAIDKVAKS